MAKNRKEAGNPKKGLTALLLYTLISGYQEKAFYGIYEKDGKGHFR